MPTDSDRLATLVLVRQRPDALLRVVSACHRRGWTATAMTWTTDGAHGEVALRLVSPRGRCRAASVAAHLRGLVDVLDVVCDDDARLPDDVALAALRTRAPWRVATPGVLVAV
jgi:acetolactate synthase regulatory subunit